MHAIARYKLVDHWRRHGRREALHDTVDDFDDWPAEDAPQEAAAARRDLGTLLAQLPSAQRRAIELTKLEGLSVAEAALETGDSASAIKVQVHRGLKRLAARVRPGASEPRTGD
jgi:RNA polymerase sigma-70 factor (ECF subfamily)